MTTRTLPHDQYIAAVHTALTAADLPPTETWTEDTDSRGTYCYLGAVITLDPDRTTDLDRIPAGTRWPHGLILTWEWHTGIEEQYGEPERGGVWLFAQAREASRTEYPTTLPVAGYASPAAVVDAVRKVISGEITPGHFHNGGAPGWDGGTIGDQWEHTAELTAACSAWGDAEAAS